MLKKSSGFTLLEVIASFSVLMFIMLTIIPLFLFMSQAKEEIKIRRTATSILHNNIQSYLYDSTGPLSKEEVFKNQVYEIEFQSMDKGIVEGCISWETKMKDGEVCLYAKRKAE